MKRAFDDVTTHESPYVDDDFRVQKDTFERYDEPDVRVYVIPRDANTALECYGRDPEFKKAVDLVARGDVPNGDDFPDEPAKVLRSNAGRQLAVESQYLAPPDTFKDFDECVARTKTADVHRKSAARNREHDAEPQGSTSEDTDDRRFVVTLAVERVANRVARTLQSGADRLMVDTSGPEPGPVEEAKQAYIDGELTIDEYESRLEDVLEE